jgi:glycosyltransferase involved in cell wall biosynthesis
MEGFGMTAVEAIGAGCPVIATDIPIFRETLKGNGILVNPSESQELRNEIISLMTNQSYYDSIQSNLLNIRDGYSWEQMTPKLLKGYRELF